VTSVSTGPPPARRMRELRMAATGHPAPFGVTAPAYALAVSGWVAAAAALVASADVLAEGAIFGSGPVLAAHLVALVLFPCAVAAAVWQLLPVMLRNDPPTRRLRPVVLPLLAAGVPLAAGIALDVAPLAAAGAVLLALGLVMLLAEAAALIRGAPPGRTLVVSRPAIALALAHAAVAFALGAVAFADGGPDPLGIPYARFLLIHLSVALIGWLTVLIAAVGRTLVPMLGLAATPPKRSAPLAEAGIVAGLWIYVAGLALGADGAVVAGIAVMVAGLSPVALRFLRVARTGTIGVREGPVAHVAVGLAFLLQAAALGVLASLGEVDAYRGATAAVVLLGLGWAAGVILGHLGKLVSLSGWGSWPPGPRPRQEALYPTSLWQLEVVAFATGVELLGLGVLAGSPATALAGALAVAAAALLAAAAVGKTLALVTRGRRRG